MMSPQHFTVGIFLLALVASSMAQPCIECKDCKGSNHCLSNCKRECPKPQIKVDGELCKRYGREAGETVAKAACDTTLTYCNGGQRPVGSKRSGKFPVSLGQCANIAYGTCQAKAADTYKWWGACTRGLRSGQNQCNKDQFNSFFNGEVNDRCNQAVSWIDKNNGGKK